MITARAMAKQARAIEGAVEHLPVILEKLERLEAAFAITKFADAESLDERLDRIETRLGTVENSLAGLTGKANEADARDAEALSLILEVLTAMEARTAKAETNQPAQPAQPAKPAQPANKPSQPAQPKGK